MSNISKHAKKYNSDFKLKVVLKYLSETITVAEICSEFNISKAALHKWVNQFKASSNMIFDENSLLKVNQKQQSLVQKETDKLYTKIGELTVERDFLKKALGL